MGMDKAFRDFHLSWVQEKARQCNADGPCRGGVSVVRQKEIIRQSLVRTLGLNVSEYTNIPRRSNTKVSDFYGDEILMDYAGSIKIENKVRIIFVGNLKGQAFQPNIGPQFAALGALGTFDQFVRRPRQANRKEAENYRENGDENCSNGYNFLMVAMDESPSLSKSSFDDAASRGAIIFIGLICFAGFACVYWWLITRD